MRVLLTGATGQVGGRLVPRLLGCGEHVRVLVRDAARAESLAGRGAEVILGDLCDPGTVARAVEGMDAVVHLAAVIGRDAPPGRMASVNRDASVALGRAAVRAGASRYVFASTAHVYGPGRGRPADECDEPCPPYEYAVSKALAESALLRMHEEDGLGVRILRLAAVYGYGDPRLTACLGRVRTWPAHRRMHLVHHADAGQALLRALYADGVDGRVFNVADDAPVTSAELHRLHGRPLDPDAAGRPLDHPWAGIVDTTRIRAELGFRPVFPTVYTARDAGAM